MILFESDYNKSRYPIYFQTNTKNTSFLKMSILLKRMGINNNKNFLVLTQPELMNVDPHDEANLSDELRLRIAYECEINPWYYFREVVRIPTQGSAPLPFMLHRGNLALIWCYYNRTDIIMVAPRQLGKTISTNAIFSHVIYISGRNITIAMLTKDNKLRMENVVRLKDIRDALPSYLYHKQSKDSDNKEGISYTVFKNKYQTYVAQSDESGADNLGRGMTIPTQHWDEIGMFKNIQITYPVALNSTNTAVDTARANNQPCSNILTTTAGKLDTKEGRFTHSLITGSLVFTEKFYDLNNKEELDEIVKLGSEKRMIYASFSYLQLGKTHEWFKEKASRANASADDIDRDYKNIWKMGSTSTIFSQELLKRIKNSQQDPKHTTIEKGYVFRWYVDKEYIDSFAFSNKKLIMGMDSSENIGRDFTALVIIDPVDLSIVGTCRCNESNIMRLALYIFELLRKYTGILFIPERNSTGTSIVDFLLMKFQEVGINAFTRIFNQVIQNNNESPFNKINIHNKDIDGPVRKYFGFRTTSGEDSRKFLYKTVLLKALDLNADKMVDASLIEEITSLVVKNGRVDHTSGGHDDTVIAFLLACYVLFAGKNLKLYGLESKYILRQVTAAEEKEESDNKYHEQLEIEKMKLEQLMKRSTSELLRMTYIRKIKEIDDILNSRTKEVEPISLEKMRNERKDIVREATKHISDNTAIEIFKYL